MNLPETLFNPKQTCEKANHSSKKKREKGKGKKKSQNYDFCACCVFHQTEANLAAIQLQNHQNVKKKKQFWQKVPGVNGLIFCRLA